MSSSLLQCHSSCRHNPRPVLHYQWVIPCNMAMCIQYTQVSTPVHPIPLCHICRMFHLSTPTMEHSREFVSLLLVPMDSPSSQQGSTIMLNNLQFLLPKHSQVRRTVCSSSSQAMTGFTAQMAGVSVSRRLQQATSHLQQGWSSDVHQLLASFIRSEYLSLSNLTKSQQPHTLILSSRGTKLFLQLHSSRSRTKLLLTN